MFPGYSIRAVTNGVHAPTWTHPAFARLFDSVAPNWCHDPHELVAADQLSDAAVWSAHEEAKGALLSTVRALTGVEMTPDRPLIAFSRRMTGYKRPDLLFADVERLRAIHRCRPFQVVFAGKAHPDDDVGKGLIRSIHDHMRRLQGEIAMAFLPNYDMALAKALVAGADVWLNNPQPPLEASGTSGMKAALNGVLNLSVLDGWWIEAWIEGVTGWAIGGVGGKDGDHGRLLLDKLESAVLPLYYDDRGRWIWMMKEAISKIGPRFNSQRMMRRYASEAYLR
jgi:starch phosphorylase